MAEDGQDAQDAQKLIGNEKLDWDRADNLGLNASKSYSAKEAEELAKHKNEREESTKGSACVSEEVAWKDAALKEKLVDSGEVRVIGTTSDSSEEANEQKAIAHAGGGGEESKPDHLEEADEQAVTAEMPALKKNRKKRGQKRVEVVVSELDAANANREMPALTKDLRQASDDTRVVQTKPIEPESSEVPNSTVQEIHPVVDPTVQKAEQESHHVNEGKRAQEIKLDVGAHSMPPPHTVGKIGWNGRRDAGIEDPHGVQEVLDALPLWREDSQVLRANYPTTTAYRVAIKKKRSTSIGNALFLIFSILLLLGVGSALLFYFVHSIAGQKSDLPAATVQEARPTSRVGVPVAGAETTAPTSNGRVLAGYQWINGGTKHELYIDASNHIQELTTSDNQNWQITDLTKRSGAAVANGRTLAGFEWQHGNSEQVVYIDAKRHVQLLSSSSNSQWDVMDLTRKARAPLANGAAIAGYEWTQNGSEQVVYIDQRSHIQELASDDGFNWRVSDLTALTKAPQADGNVITGYESGRLGSKQVDYIAINQHVQELSFAGGSWQDTDLNSLVGAPLANDKTLIGYEWRQTGTSQIGYLDTSNHVQLLSSTSIGSWSLLDLTLLVKAPAANGNTLVGYDWQQGGCDVLYFIDGNNHIQEMSDAPGENWQLVDLNQFTLSAPPPNGKALFGYDWAQHGSKQVVYIDIKNTVRELTSSNVPGKWDLSSWKHR